MPIYVHLYRQALFLHFMQPDDNIIQQLVKALNGKRLCCMVKFLQKSKRYAHLNAYVLDWTKSMPDIPYTARLYYAVHKMTSYVKCANPSCNNDIPHSTKFKPLVGPVIRHCCMSCAQSDPDVQHKIEQTSTIRYGCKRPSQSEEHRKQMSEHLQNMPQEHWDNALAKRKHTCREKYGVDSVSQVKDVRDRAAATFKSKPREELERMLEQAKQAKIAKYGDASNGKKISETKKSFTKERNDTINEKRRKTVQQMYGVDVVSQRDDIKQKASSVRLANYYSRVILANCSVEPLFTKEEFIASPFGQLHWRCKTCGNEFYAKRYEHCSVNMMMLARCLKCYPLNCPQSKTETCVFDFVKSICNGIIQQGVRNVIAPKELDIYLEDAKMAIEFNGVAWHSLEYGTPEDYHLQKTIACEQKGIFLLHVFENEWKCKNAQVKAHIERLLHYGMHSIEASECDMCTVCNTEAQLFYRDNSFTAFKKALCTYGLRHNGSLVFCAQAMQSSRSAMLCNICFKVGVDVVHALSRIANALSKHIAVQVAVDRRLWPRSILDGILCSKLSCTKPHKRFCICKLKEGLVDELSEDDASSLRYTVCDSGDIIADIII